MGATAEDGMRSDAGYQPVRLGASRIRRAGRQILRLCGEQRQRQAQDQEIAFHPFPNPLKNSTRLYSAIGIQAPPTLLHVQHVPGGNGLADRKGPSLGAFLRANRFPDRKTGAPRHLLQQRLLRLDGIEALRIGGLGSIAPRAEIWYSCGTDKAGKEPCPALRDSFSFPCSLPSAGFPSGTKAPSNPSRCTTAPTPRLTPS